MTLRLLLWLPVSAVVGSTILIVMASSQSGSTAPRPLRERQPRSIELITEGRKRTKSLSKRTRGLLKKVWMALQMNAHLAGAVGSTSTLTRGIFLFRALSWPS